MVSRLLKSRQRLAVLDRKVIVTKAVVGEFAIEIVRLQRDLKALAVDTEGSQRAAIEAMINHARALEQRYRDDSIDVEP